MDVTVIRKDDITRYRTYENAAGDASEYKAKYARPAKLTPPPGTSFVISETFKPHKQAAAVAAVAPVLVGGGGGGGGGASSGMDV